MMQSLREETEGKLQMQLSPRKNGLTSLFKEVRVLKGLKPKLFHADFLFETSHRLAALGQQCQRAPNPQPNVHSPV